jgi:RecA/RadA recombinase
VQLCLTIAAAAAQQGEAVLLIDALNSLKARRLAQILAERFHLV